jgi:pimeloyl-ACP methyl ester carboxylesterase
MGSDVAPKTGTVIELPGAAPADPGRVWMVPQAAEVRGRRLVYAISDNDMAHGPGGGEPIWAVNLHGYFAGGGMYWRESARLAGGMQWRVVNPSLPGFGGSEPIPWADLSMESLADVISGLLDHLDIEQAVVLGHSMGGAVAVRFAHDHPDRCLGIICRDAAVPGTWKERKGLLPRLLDTLAPDIGNAADLMLGALADVPDLAWGRAGAMVKGVLPDAWRNVGAATDALPVAAMLFGEDLDHVVEAVGRGPVPVLPVWGRFDRLVPPSTARDFSNLVDEPVVWVSGGHSWMLPRPVTQRRVLQAHPQGRSFVDEVHARLRVEPARRQARPPRRS